MGNCKKFTIPTIISRSFINSETIFSRTHDKLSIEPIVQPQRLETRQKPQSCQASIRKQIQVLPLKIRLL